MVLALRIYQFQRPMQARCRIKVQANAQRMLAIKKANYKVKLRRKFDLIGVQSVARRNVPHIFPISHFHLPGPCRSVYVRVRSLPAQLSHCFADAIHLFALIVVISARRPLHLEQRKRILIASLLIIEIRRLQQHLHSNYVPSISTQTPPI